MNKQMAVVIDGSVHEMWRLARVFILSFRDLSKQDAKLVKENGEC